MNLHHIGTVLLKPQEDFLEIASAIDAYKKLLTYISEIDLASTESREDLIFENGIAIGTTWAATCLEDILRTKRFVRGIHLAIETRRKTKDGPIHLLYAGSGPYATLILPILALYSPSEVHVSLLEINPRSLANVKLVIQKLGFDQHVVNYYREDASTFQIPNAKTIDILISETMQHALQKEQQVPIMYNLVPQLSENALLIPEKISLEIAIMSMGDLADKNLKPFILGEAFDLSIEKIHSDLKHIKPTTNLSNLQAQELSMDQFQLDKKKHTLLAILTTIHVFEDQLLKNNESGLTAPKIIRTIDETFLKLTRISTEYRIGKENELSVGFENLSLQSRRKPLD